MNFNFERWAMLEPMKYYDKPDDSALSASLLQKKYDMIENKNNEYVASQKWDGEWTMFIKGVGDQILIRSRSLSKVTGAYGDKTQHVPHLVEEMKQWADGTVVLGELCWDELGKVSTDVGTILRCLPAKAVERQKDHKLVVKAFDILCVGGEDISDRPYESRIHELEKFFSVDKGYKYFGKTDFFGINFQEAADSIISRGGEGVVIQRKDNKYESGKRAAWHTLKLKQHIQEMELPIVATKDATKEYKGSYGDSWEFKIDGQNVSKAYYYGWKMGITVNFNGTLVDASSGLTDDDRAWLATEEAQTLIKNGQLYASIKCMMVASLGGLRHPVIKKIRIMDDAMLK